MTRELCLRFLCRCFGLAGLVACKHAAKSHTVSPKVGCAGVVTAAIATVQCVGVITQTKVQTEAVLKSASDMREVAMIMHTSTLDSKP